MLLVSLARSFGSITPQMHSLSSLFASLHQASLSLLNSFATNRTAMSVRADSPCGSGRSSPSLEGADSGYASAANSESDMPELYFTKPHLRFLNRQLQFLEPQEILRWAITTIPNLYQTTAFGLTGLVSLDMLSKLKVPRPQMVDLVFLDTLHHFPETLELVERVRARYPLVNIHTFKPAGVETAEEFKEKYGDKLWETDDNRYDYLVKVEPAQRAYRELNAYAVLTGRRRSQGGARGSLDIIEVDEAGLLKINPLANWTFEQIKQYIDENNVPYNALLDKGYKSVGDWHSTQPVQVGEDERAGRWKGQQKTECGIHNPRSKYAQFLMEQEKQREREALGRALEKVSLEGQL
ncbi:phosphoadenosine phosphosulfate reductase [Phialophora macrospora]|uniref:phosphoadenylyl-sulfate reductase (thioredoxin) n=1 Tax=Phialophora macrospora TaxID=1851006 RepID=A0A0D2FKE3_9EURO|nr:phosphoadenosine phosphosulfate reductase [Phialophora macrospora]